MATGTPATHRNVEELAAALSLDEAAYRRALEVAELTPDAGAWRRYVDRFLSAAGALLIVAGTAAFFAWNWAALHHLAKLALIQAGLAAAVLLAWRLGIDGVAGRASLLAGAFLVGVALAVFGQAYQTGADPYGLFLAWAVLILPWVVVGRQPGLWLLLQVLLNLTLVMYWTQVLHPPPGQWVIAELLGPVVWLGATVLDGHLASWLFALNAAALVAWELAADRGIAWLEGRTFPRLVALLAFYAVVAPTLVLIAVGANGLTARLSLVSPLLCAAAVAACLWYYRRRKLDLFMLTAALSSAILVIMAAAIDSLLGKVEDSLLLALLLIAQVAAAAYWLRHVAQRGDAGA